MKVKLSKRMLCAMLSLIMALTSLPFTVYAETEEEIAAQAISALNEAIENYEIKMNGTIFTNMSSAYEAYRNAHLLYDDYVYGPADQRPEIGDDDSTDKTTVKGAAKVLNDAVEQMEVWDAANGQIAVEDKKASGPDTLEAIKFVNPTTNDDGEHTSAEGTYQNIIYSPIITRDNPSASIGVSQSTTKLYYGTPVVLYTADPEEGKKPRIPILAAGQSDNESHEYYIWAIYPTADTGSIAFSTEISLPDYWLYHDATNSLDHWWAYDPAKSIKQSAYSAYTGMPGIQSASYRSNRLNFNNINGSIMANYINVDYKMDDGEYTKTINASWFVSTDVSANSQNYKNGAGTPIYMVNYEALTDAITRNSQKLSIGTSHCYGNGGLEAVIKAFDDAIKYDPTSSFSSVTNVAESVNKAGETIESLVNALDASERTPDPTVYKDLKEQIEVYRERYDQYSNYTEDNPANNPNLLFSNWEAFKTLYENALQIMSDATSAEPPYPDDRDKGDENSLYLKAEKAAADLKAFVFQPQSKRVDTSVLENVIGNAEYVANNPNFFVLETTYTNPDGSSGTKTVTPQEIKDAVKAAKEAIWGGNADYYPLEEYKLEESPENFMKVMAQMGNITALIRDMQINFEAIVPYANDAKKPDGYSLNGALKRANDFKPEEYSNYIVLQNAVDTANLFKQKGNPLANLSEPGTQNYAMNLVGRYQDTTLAIVDAWGSLFKSFSHENNGQILYPGDDLMVTTENTANYNKRTITLTFSRHNNLAFLRTTHDAMALDICNPVFSLTQDGFNLEGTYNDSAGGKWTLVDSINFNESEDVNTKYSETDNTYEPTITDNNTNKAHDPTGSDLTTIQGFKGNLEAKVKNTDTNYVISNIYGKTTTNSSNLFGRLANGKGVGKDLLATETPFDDALKITEANNTGGLLTETNGSMSTYISDYKLNVSPSNPNTNPGADLNGASMVDYTYSGHLGMMTRAMYRGDYNWDLNRTYKWHINYGYSTVPYSQTTTIIDTSNLTDLINWVDNNIDTNKYTTDSLNKLAEAEAAADAPIDYWTMNDGMTIQQKYDEIVNEVNSRYKKLWEASHEWNAESDSDQVYNPETDFGLIERADFASDYELDKQGSPVPDGEGGYKIENYGYIDTWYLLFRDINEHEYTSESLKKLAEAIRDFKYLNYTPEQMANVPITEQEAIEAERQEFAKWIYNSDFKAWLDNSEASPLVPANSNHEYENLYNGVKSLNADDYDTGKINDAINEHREITYVEINGEQVRAYDYDVAMAHIETVKNSVSRYEYTVAVHDRNNSVQYLKADYDESSKSYSNFRLDTEGNATKFHYGDSVEVTNGSGSVGWYCTVSAQGTVNKQQPKYLLTAETYSFNVRGNTDLYIGDNGDDSEYVKITFIDNTHVQNTIAFDYVKSGEPYPLSNTTVPNRMFYTIDSYTVMEDRKPTGEPYTSADSPSFTKDTTLLVSYTPIGTAAYKIVTLPYNDNGESQTQQANYNTRVTVYSPGGESFDQVMALMDNDTHKLLTMGNTYTFYACQDLNVKPLTGNTYSDLYKKYGTGNGGDGDENFDVSVIKSPVISGKKAQFVGSFAQLKSDGITITGAGIILDAGTFVDSIHRPLGDLKLSDVNNAKKILNLSVPVSSILNQTGNQFAVSIGFSNMPAELQESGAAISYVAYISYKDSAGNQKYVYSNVVDTAVLK